MRQADLTNPALPLPVANWTLCLEVAEHIPKHLEAAFLANVAKTNSRGLVLSWANQPGNGHVNNKAPKQVVERLQQLGYVAPAPNLNVIFPFFFESCEKGAYFPRAGSLRDQLESQLTTR